MGTYVIYTCGILSMMQRDCPTLVTLGEGEMIEVDVVMEDMNVY